MSVRIGARGTPVTQIQESLNTHGASGLGVDGRFGRDTRAAVVAFQRSHGLEPDGVVGPRTAAALGLSGDAFEPASPGWAKVRHRDGATGYMRSTQVWGL